MVANAAETDACDKLEPMQTECPHCHTLFRLTEAQLDMAGGQVRCGNCYAVFNALYTDDFSHAHSQLDVSESIPATTKETDQNGAQQSDDQARATTPELTETETASTLHENDRSETFADELDEAVPDHYDASFFARHSSWSTPLWSIANLILIFSLLTEYAWFNRGQLQNQPELQPYFAVLCEHIHCDGLISLHDPDSIEMLSRNVYTHPNEKNALMITATMISHASFAQALPDVQIDFSSTRGDVVASRRFKPAEYLQPDHDPLQQMQPEIPVSFNLEIVDPGKDAITYEFMFL